MKKTSPTHRLILLASLLGLSLVAYFVVRYVNDYPQLEGQMCEAVRKYLQDQAERPEFSFRHTDSKNLSVELFRYWSARDTSRVESIVSGYGNPVKLYRCEFLVRSDGLTQAICIGVVVMKKGENGQDVKYEVGEVLGHYAKPSRSCINAANADNRKRHHPQP